MLTPALPKFRPSRGENPAVAHHLTICRGSPGDGSMGTVPHAKTCEDSHARLRLQHRRASGAPSDGVRPKGLSAPIPPARSGTGARRRRPEAPPSATSWAIWVRPPSLLHSPNASALQSSLPVGLTATCFTGTGLSLLYCQTRNPAATRKQTGSPICVPPWKQWAPRDGAVGMPLPFSCAR